MPELRFLIFLAASYTAAVALGAWFVMTSERRQQLRGLLQVALSTRRLRTRRLLRKNSEIHGQFFASLKRSGADIRTACRRHKLALVIAVTLLLAPALLALYLAPDIGLESYRDQPQALDPVVASLLRGEQLVPPAPLPPEAFITKEVQAERNEIASASRDWSALDGEFRQRLLAVYQLMAARGYQMALLEGYRSPNRQAELAKLGSHVTNAGAYQSYHQFGLAADNAFYRDAKLFISEKDPWVMEAYRLYGQYAESVGLVWGGRWQMRDLGHVELRRPYLLKRN